MSCELYRRVYATEAQKKVFADNWSVMETYADQVITNNDAYEEHCMKVTK